MRIFLCLLALLLGLVGCKKSETTSQAKLDACSLLTSAEIKAIQGSAIIEAKANEHSDAGLRMSQCYFSAEQSNKSVSLVVTQSDPDHPSNRTPKDFWKETFGHGSIAEKEHDGDKEGEEHESPLPMKIEGIGDEAYWAGSRVGGALYAIKKNTFIRISVGGPDSQEIKIDKSKKLAEKALGRL
jgi:hypothetical protein